MSLEQFLRLLAKQDGIRVQFSHLGYIVKRNGVVLDSRGHHVPTAKAATPTERVHRTSNMYCSLAVACAYCNDDLRSLAGDVLATMRPGGRV